MPTLKKTGRGPARGPGLLLALCALAAWFPAAAGAADVEFYAVADRDEMGLEDTLTLTVTVSAAMGEEGQVQLPEAPDFQVISRSQVEQTSFSMSGGGPSSFRKVRNYTLLLVPRRAGTLTIHPGRLSAGGKTYETATIRVKVVPGRANPPQAATPPPPRPPPANPFGFPPNLFDDPDAADAFDQLFGTGGGAARPTTDSDLFLRMVTDRRQAYLGEQIVLSIYLFSRVEVSGVDNPRFPKLDGFWAEDIETPSQISGELKVIDGVPYRVFLLRKRALFPIKAGKLTVDAVEVDVNTGMGMMFSGRKVHRAAQPLTIEVQPLPTGAPAGFEASNVGQWKLSAEAAPTKTTLGQPVTLKVVLEGVGNVRNVAPPKLPPVRGFRLYDPTVNEKVSTARGRFGGTRVLEYLLMPEQTGALEIPSLSFSFFNPSTGQYQTAQTQPIPVQVEAGQGVAARPGLDGGAASLPDRAVNVISAAGLRPLRYKGVLSRPGQPVWQRPYFIPLVATPLVAWLGLLAVGMIRSTVTGNDPGRRRKQAGSRARKRLRHADELLRAHQAGPFYAEVSRALHEYLGDKLGSPVLGLTRDELAGRLAELSAPPEAIARLTALLDTCDAGRFAPGASESATMAGVRDGALAVMGELESARLAPKEDGR